MKTRNITPPTWLLIALISMLSLHFLSPIAWVIPRLWNISGLVLIVLGVILNLIADKAFKQAQTTVKPFKVSSTLVTKGVFRMSRNPMYLGFMLVLAGTAVLLRSLSPYLIIIAFMVMIDKIFIRAEEEMLAEKFDTEWMKYKSRPRRWL